VETGTYKAEVREPEPAQEPELELFESRGSWSKKKIVSAKATLGNADHASTTPRTASQTC
jgi:hypothetical protein